MLDKLAERQERNKSVLLKEAVEQYLQNNTINLKEFFMSKEAVRKEFQQLSKKEQMELLKEYDNVHLSTDEDSYHNSREEDGHYKIKKAGELQERYGSYYKPIDKYDNCELSIAIEQKKFQMIKDVFGLKDCSDAELLKTIAFDVTNFSSIGHPIAVSILGAVVDQLDVMGEDTSDISYI